LQEYNCIQRKFAVQLHSILQAGRIRFNSMQLLESTIVSSSVQRKTL
jgi:hypothetical protein